MNYLKQRNGFIFFEVMIALAAASMLVSASFELLGAFMNRCSKAHHELAASYALQAHIIEQEFIDAQGKTEKKEKLSLSMPGFVIEETTDKTNFAGIPGFIKDRFTVKDESGIASPQTFCTFLHNSEATEKKEKT